MEFMKSILKHSVSLVLWFEALQPVSLLQAEMKNERRQNNFLGAKLVGEHSVIHEQP